MKAKAKQNKNVKQQNNHKTRLRDDPHIGTIKLRL